MGRKSEQQILTEAIVALTKAVNKNTLTLAQAMGQSEEQSKELVKQLQDRPPVPENETLEQFTERLSGGLVSNPLQVSVFAEEGKRETLYPLEQQTPLQGMLGRITQQGAPDVGREGENPG